MVLSTNLYDEAADGLLPKAVLILAEDTTGLAMCRELPIQPAGGVDDITSFLPEIDQAYPYNLRLVLAQIKKITETFYYSLNPSILT